MEMLRRLPLLCAAAAFLAAPVFAQTPSGDATASTTSKTIQMVPAKATLSKTLDAKKVKQGDAVTAKLTDKVQIPGSMELPKGTELIGRVDKVTPSEHKSPSSIQVTFDKAQLKNGQQLALKATVVRIMTPINAMMAGQQGGGAPASSGAAPMAAPGPPMGGGGGAPGGNPGMAQQQPMPAPQPGMAPAPGPSQQTQQQSGVNGVTLKSDIHDQDSGTFTSKDRNVHVPSGTEMEFALAYIPPNTKLQ